MSGPGLIERDEHLLHIDRVLADCVTQRGRAVLMEGPHGCGKTELQRIFAERSEASGFRLFGAVCSPAERTVPFGVVNQLFGHICWPDGPAAPRGARLLERLAAMAAGDAPPTAPKSADEVRIHSELAYLLGELAARQPILIGADDLRHADGPSLNVLLHLFRWAGSARRVLLVLTDEPSLRPPALRTLTELSGLPHVHRLTLTPLSGAGAERLIAERLGRQTALRLGADFRAVGGGNPLLLNGLIEDHLRTGDGPRPSGYGTALLNCLRHADPVVTQVVRALAVLGDDSSPAELGRLAGWDTAVANQALRALDAADLLDRGRFRHPVARTAILDDLSSADRAELHRRAADLLHDRGATAPRVAHHLVAADHTHAPWTTDVLSEAARHALIDDDVELAADCLRLAHRSCADESARAAIRARLAAAEWQVDPALATRHFAPLAAAARTGRLRLTDSTVLVRNLLWHGRDEEAAGLVGLLRARAEQTDAASRTETAGASGNDACGLRDLEAWLAYTYPPLAAERRAFHPAADRPPLPHGRGGHLQDDLIAPDVDPQLRSVAVMTDALLRDRGHEVADRAGQVLRDLPLHRRSPWTEDAVLLALQVLLLADRLSSTVSWCDWLSPGAEIGAPPTLRAFLTAARGGAALHRGIPAAAAEDARAALTALPPTSWGVAVGLPLGISILARTRLGEFDEAARELARPVPEEMFRSFYATYYLYARGHYHLATDHGHAALADFLTCGELLRDWGLDAIGLLPWRTDAAEAWLKLGNPGQARRLAQEQLRRSGPGTSRTRGPALRVLAAVSPPGRRLPLLTEAIDLAEAADDRFEQAKVLAELSRVYHTAKNKRRARLMLRQALHLTNTGSMRQLAQELLSVSAELGGTGATADAPEGIGSLTDSERRVAALAVLGHTNREIATRLYITSSTVEQHLTRVYRKLRIRHRGELPAELWGGLSRTG
ncbi:AAA family ATPase [Streptomyces sp. NPDC055025]